MGILRSETMRHGTLVLPAERARVFVEKLPKIYSKVCSQKVALSKFI